MSCVEKQQEIGQPEQFQASVEVDYIEDFVKSGLNAGFDEFDDDCFGEQDGNVPDVTWIEHDASMESAADFESATQEIKK